MIGFLIIACIIVACVSTSNAGKNPASDTAVIYDKRLKKIYFIIMLVAFVSAVAGFFVGYYATIYTANFMVIIGLVLLLEGCPTFLLSGIRYLKACFYLSRLHKNGFELPEDRRNTKSLEELQRTGEPVENRYYKDSVIAAVFALVSYVGFVISDVTYIAKWSGMDFTEQAVFFFVPMFIFHTLLVVVAFIFYRQRNREKYVDDVDIKKGRKVRYNIMSAIIGIIALAGVALIVSVQVETMTKYAWKSVEHEKEYGESWD